MGGAALSGTLAATMSTNSPLEQYYRTVQSYRLSAIFCASASRSFQRKFSIFLSFPFLLRLFLPSAFALSPRALFARYNNATRRQQFATVVGYFIDERVRRAGIHPGRDDMAFKYNVSRASAHIVPLATDSFSNCISGTIECCEYTNLPTMNNSLCK